MKSIGMIMLAVGMAVMLLGVGVQTGQADLVSHWKMDDASGSATDSGPAGNDWPAYSVDTYSAPAVFGTGFYFNGGWAHYMNLGRTIAWPTVGADYESQPGESFSAVGWYASDNATSLGTISLMMKGAFNILPAWAIQTWGTAANGIQFKLLSSGLNVTAQMASTPLATYFNGSFHHVAGVYDGTTGTLKLYVDGIEVDSVTNAGATAVAWGYSNSTLQAMWNGNAAYNPNMGEGTLDDLAYFDHALSPGEVQTIYNSGVAALSVSTPGTLIYGK